ncbi:MAG: YbcC family protein [Burkholderiaceae bacterium]
MSASTSADPALLQAVHHACERIAPTWPLDRFIAVNPLWEYRDLPLRDAAARWAALAGIDLSGAAVAGAVKLPLLVDELDARRDLAHRMPWRDALTHAIGQFCGDWFDRDFAVWPHSAQMSLYRAWREQTRTDRGLAPLFDKPDWRAAAARLPETPDALFAYAQARLAVPDEAWEPYLEALLLSILGWASWAAQLRWQARLEGGDDGSVRELLAVRLAWECLLDDGQRGPGSAHARWINQWRGWSAAQARAGALQAPAWERLSRNESRYRQALIDALRAPADLPAPQSTPHPTPLLQAVFCIDVRSEPMRRALEAQSPAAIQTFGYAGFFGLPITYRPLGTASGHPQLPGPLAPACTVTDAGTDDAPTDRLAQTRRNRLAWAERWRGLKQAPASMFGMVETLGLGKLASLLRGSADAPAEQAGLSAAERACLTPRLSDDAGNVDLAARVLRTMGLTGDFGRILLLVGHGSTSANNPHAAGLDCGACGGHSGEVNARALADLLNRAAVRAGLVAQHGIELPPSTRVVAALHDTATDHVRLFDVDGVPAGHRSDLARIDAWLTQAGAETRKARAPRLGLAHLAADPLQLERALVRRAHDPAQTRPEWGLAGNAAFIAAPRARTRGRALDGRCFLHDYRWQDDADGSVLTLVMTAPMVVGHWINFQYYASAVAPDRLGSGNKTLHNVVGGRLGVFEGNGGDLRIGLPWQSVHDGERFAHEPLRLSAFIEAPRAMIDAVLARHDTVRQLVEHEWLSLWRLEPGAEGLVVEQYRSGRWFAVAMDAASRCGLAPAVAA